MPRPCDIQRRCAHPHGESSADRARRGTRKGWNAESSRRQPASMALHQALKAASNDRGTGRYRQRARAFCRAAPRARRRAGRDPSPAATPAVRTLERRGARFDDPRAVAGCPTCATHSSTETKSHRATPATGRRSWWPPPLKGYVSRPGLPGQPRQVGDRARAVQTTRRSGSDTAGAARGAGCSSIRSSSTEQPEDACRERPQQSRPQTFEQSRIESCKVPWKEPKTKGGRGQVPPARGRARSRPPRRSSFA